MTELQLWLLRTSEDPQGEATRRNLYQPGQLAGWIHAEILPLIPDTDEPVLRLAYNDLCQKLLLDGPPVGGVIMGSPICLGHLRLTSFGRKFIEWIRRCVSRGQEGSHFRGPKRASYRAAESRSFVGMLISAPPKTRLARRGRWGWPPAATVALTNHP